EPLMPDGLVVDQRGGRGLARRPVQPDEVDGLLAAGVLVELRGQVTRDDRSVRRAGGHLGSRLTRVVDEIDVLVGEVSLVGDRANLCRLTEEGVARLAVQGEVPTLTREDGLRWRQRT